jgi:hypothetical protein
VGTWSGTDGISHDISQHNLWSEFSLLPTFTINSLLANNYSISFVANDTVEGKTAEHLLAVRQFQAQGALFNWSAAALQRLTAMDVYLDSSTFLPAAVRFNSHPDHNDLIDIPIEARFSDYRQVGGALVPFHIQKYLNNVLALDFQVSTATFNTRLTTTALTVN